MPYDVPHKTQRVVIPVTPKDYKLWRKAAKRAELPLAEYLRRIINQQTTNNVKSDGESLDGQLAG